MLNTLPFVVWNAPLLDDSGYADEARGFVLGLDSIGLALQAKDIPWSTRRVDLPADESRVLARLAQIPPRPGFVNIQHIFPRHFQRFPEAVANIGRTMFETDRLPADWVAKCNAMDEIWVPSDFNIETFARAGVTRSRLHKIPGTIDGDRFCGNILPLHLQERRGYNFLSVFDWSLRKGWDVLVRAYLEEFSPAEDVCLFLKVHSTLGRSEEELLARIQAFIRADLRRDPGDIPAIVLLTEPIPAALMPGLYRAVDAYVMASRGEGWGRPYMEAMASGLPVIGTGWGGNTEFMTTENSYLVDYRLVDVPEAAVAEAATFRGHQWAEPQVAHLRIHMREVFTDRHAASARGARGRQDVLEKYDRPVVARQIAERLQRYGGTPAPIPVVWEGAQFDIHSLAHVNREICLRLIQTGRIDLTLLPQERQPLAPAADTRLQLLAQRVRRAPDRAAAVHVRHEWPPNFAPPASGAWVMIQPWEFGGLPADWVAPMRDRVDEIWVPSTWVRQCYIGSGIPEEKVVVIPNGVDVQRFRPKAPPLQLATRRRFKFLFVGGTIRRKGIDVLLRAYTQAFGPGDDVCLVIKDMTRTFDSTAGEQIRQLQARPDSPEILYLDDDLPLDAMPGLYTACDALVHPYRGEGFGLPIAEAMACGLPVIVTSYGACLDFCDDTTAYLIPAQEVGINRVDNRPPSSAGFWWAEPDPIALAGLMRRVLAQPEAARETGRQARARIVAEFNWDRVAALVEQRLAVLATRAPIRAARPDTAAPAVSIVIVAGSDAAFTTFCLELVHQHSPSSRELIVVDDGSDPDVAEHARAIPNVRIIATPSPRGFAAACNQGILAARGEEIVVLTADTVVTEGWLEGMLAAAARDPQIGIVVPRSNVGKDGQAVAEATYGDDLEQLRILARSRARQHAGQGTFVDSAAGFCMLVRRAVLERIGGPAPNFTDPALANDDFCLRARLAGFRIWLADDVFVHHFGGGE